MLKPVATAPRVRRPTVDLPLLAIPHVIHVGALVGRPDLTPASVEGQCLSVSLHPREWRRIAGVQGPGWLLQRDGARFLDFHRAALDGDLVSRMRRWLAREDYLDSPRMMYMVIWDDGPQQRFGTTGEKAEAKRQARRLAAQGHEVSLMRGIGRPANRRLLERMGHQRDGADLSVLLDTFGFLAYIEDTHPEVDGIWWADRLAPAQLSAPRGGIFPGRLASWSGIRLSRREEQQVAAHLRTVADPRLLGGEGLGMTPRGGIGAPTLG
jgi:hypothetical protein